MPPKEARLGHAIFRTWLLFNHEWTRMIFEPDISVPLLVIPSEVEGSLDVSARL
jgi:hypothetical protein